MKRVIIFILCLSFLNCSLFKGGNAKHNAVQALVTTTNTAVLLMTAAGLAYDTGAFGTPGSARAEDTWSKISAESIRMATALEAWQQAIKENKDASTYVSMVAQALAVITALMPTRTSSTIDNSSYLNYNFDLNFHIFTLNHPEIFV